MASETTQPPQCPTCGKPMHDNYEGRAECVPCSFIIGNPEPPPARRRDGGEVQVGTEEAYPRVGVTVRGWAWFGLLRIRIYLDDGDWRTFWHVALWKFMFGVALPAAWVNAATKKATVSDGR